ncbi:MAG: hypothetical protein Fur006_55950 [Coleofasciculaceae cyanobacterium]
MKLIFVNVLAIALLPGYSIAQDAPPYRAIAGEASNLTARWTQASLLEIAQLSNTPKNGTPKNNRGVGGTRTELTAAAPTGACKQTAQPLTALVPIEGSKSLTTAEHPVFWFYIPYAPEDIHSIEFSVDDWDEHKTLYQTSLQLTKTPGVIGISLLPPPEHPLKLNKNYKWSLTVNCQSKQPTDRDDIILDGYVTRVQQSPDLIGVIWYDELTNRAKRYLFEPQNPEVKKAWTELLKSVGLEELAPAPLVKSSQ